MRVLVLKRLYVEGIRFTIRTDNYSRNWILSLTYCICSLSCRRLGYSKFEFDLVLRATIQHQAADTISHLPTSAHHIIRKQIDKQNVSKKPLSPAWHTVSRNTTAIEKWLLNLLHMCTINRYTGVQTHHLTALYWVVIHLTYNFKLHVWTFHMAV